MTYDKTIRTNHAALRSKHQPFLPTTTEQVQALLRAGFRVHSHDVRVLPN